MFDTSRVVLSLVRAFSFRERTANFSGPEKGERLFTDKTICPQSKKIINTNNTLGKLLRLFQGALSGKCYGSGQPNQV